MMKRSHRSLSPRQKELPSLCIAILLAATVAAEDKRQEFPMDKNFPFANPQDFFEQFFGAAALEDNPEAIELIPVSVREEKQIGQRAVDFFLAEWQGKAKVVNRGKDVEYLHKLVAKIRPMMTNAHRYRKIRIYLIDSPETDARSFPGGTLVFFRGLVDFNENEAGLVGVIGHELSHLDREHQLYDTKRAKFAQESFKGRGGFSPNQFLENGALLMKSFSRPFRPGAELEADADGVRWAYEAGYDPRELAKLFLRMAERDRGKLPPPMFFRSHPYHADRYEAAIDLYHDLQKNHPAKHLVIGRENLIKRKPK